MGDFKWVKSDFLKRQLGQKNSAREILINPLPSFIDKIIQFGLWVICKYSRVGQDETDTEILGFFPISVSVFSFSVSGLKFKKFGDIDKLKKVVFIKYYLSRKWLTIIKLSQ